MNWRHIPLLILATFITYIMHEGAHWAMGEALGYNMWVSLNSAGLVEGAYRAEWHQQAVSMAGPLATVLQGIIAFFIIKKRKAIAAFTFLFAALMMRFAAMLISISNPNDEARVSEWLGLGPWALYVFVVGCLLLLTLKAGTYIKLGWKSYGLAYLVVSAAISVIVLGEAYVPRFDL